MKDQLTYEQCKRLKKWGLDQTLWLGSLFYYWGTKRFAGMLQQEEGGWVLGVCEYSPKRKTPPTYDYVKLPCAEEMIGLLGNEFHFLMKVVNAEKFAAIARDPNIDVAGNTPIQTLYALCEKVFGEQP